MDSTKQCSVDDCEKRVLGRGLCSMHYARLRKHGDVHWSRPTIAVGERYGMLTVLGIEHKVVNERGHKQKYARVICDCGREFSLNASSLLSANSRSCGCVSHRGCPTHGESKTRLYEIWCSMISRCCNAGNKSYAYYGGRGIRMCAAWRESYESFRDWARENGYDEGLTVDRINVDGNYDPSNCRFVSRIVQGNNKRNNRLFSAFGETKTVSEWARDPRCRPPRQTLLGRIRQGWKPEVALTLPSSKHNSGARKPHFYL